MSEADNQHGEEGDGIPGEIEIFASLEDGAVVVVVTETKPDKEGYRKTTSFKVPPHLGYKVAQRITLACIKIEEAAK